MNFFRPKTLVADENNTVHGSAEEIAAFIQQDIAAIKRSIQELDRQTGILSKTLNQRLYDALEKDHRHQIRYMDKPTAHQTVKILEVHADEWAQFAAMCRNHHHGGIVQHHMLKKSENLLLKRTNSDLLDPPESLVDPISFDLFLDPVVAPSGITYEKNHLVHHIKHNGPYDPLTKGRLLEDQLYPNLGIKSAVAAYIDQSMA